VKKSIFSILFAIFFLISLPLCISEEVKTLRVMTFNIWIGGAAGGQPLERTTEAIRKSKADIVGMQETISKSNDSSKIIADSLGWHHLAQGGNTSIISRFPIESSTANKWGATISVTESTKVHFFNAHFRPSPYQPYQLKKIPYGNAPFIKTAEEAIHWANKSRGDQVDRLLKEVIPTLKLGEPVFITGDFNEPSFQDWTKRASEKKIVPLEVKFPTTTKVVQAGLIDTFRKIHTNEIKERGYTWTNITKPEDPNDFHDRIDFVFSKGAEIVDSQIVGENNRNAHIVLNPWPSDHRAVVSTVKIKINKKNARVKSGSEPLQ